MFFFLIKVETQVDSASSEVLLDGQEHTLRQERMKCFALLPGGEIEFSEFSECVLRITEVKATDWAPRMI